MREITKVLEIMKTSTNMMSTGKSVTASLILPMKAAIMQQLRTVDEELSAVCNECRMAIVHDLEDRYTDPESVRLLEISAALDPRFKSLSWLSAPEKEVVYSRVIDMAVAHKEKENEASEAISTAAEQSGNISNTNPESV